MKRKLLTLIILLATVFGIVAVSNINTKADAVDITKDTTLYFKPTGNLVKGDERYAAYFYTNSQKKKNGLV